MQSLSEADFPDIQMPRAEREGFDLVKFQASQLLELEGSADADAADALLKPFDLLTMRNSAGRARVSIGSMRYNSMGGLSRPGELWFAIVARPIAGGQVGYAYVTSVTDSGFTVFVGTKLWGLRYERGALRMDGPQPRQATIDREGAAYARLRMHASPATRTFQQVVDFPVYTPGKKTMQVFMEGPVLSRLFDPACDEATFAEGTRFFTLSQRLQFTPYRWVSHAQAHGALRFVR